MEFVTLCVMMRHKVLPNTMMVEVDHKQIHTHKTKAGNTQLTESDWQKERRKFVKSNRTKWLYQWTWCGNKPAIVMCSFYTIASTHWNISHTHMIATWPYKVEFSIMLLRGSWLLQFCVKNVFTIWKCWFFFLKEHHIWLILKWFRKRIVNYETMSLRYGVDPIPVRLKKEILSFPLRFINIKQFQTKLDILHTSKEKYKSNSIQHRCERVDANG